ncbi:RNA-binding domain-containing protein [Ascobolus immersus RN42]|uniref:RNA-binding domain-containing protein n=1 Tax=Ascobolus immersus RN42 TaxID=1160509 RepID=A0A3N4IGL3_ASCIM|nr:RNA-binding domain-containing protein [Ascobolus immersus RN42]
MSATVEQVTNALEQTSINEAPAQAQNQNQNEGNKEAENEAHAASAAEGRRLYIGNLAYATTEDNLREFFKGYKIESISIPNNPRSGRAVGYAFVDLVDKEDAERAMKELSGKELVERNVSVQLARKPTTKSTEGSEEGAASGEDKGKGERPAKRGRGGFRGRGRGRGGRGGFKARNGGSANGQEGHEEHPTNVPGQVLPLTETTNITAEATAVTDSGKEDKKKTENKEPKQPKKRGPPENGVPSKTKVMVANLPYELSEEKLKELFAAYQPESAKIALRPIPRFMVKKLQMRGEPRKGRGFGFVTLASEELQQKAVAEMNGKEVEGREIAVKVAIDNPKIEEAAAEAAAAAAAAEGASNGEKKADAAPAENKAPEAAAAAPAATPAAAPATASA